MSYAVDLGPRFVERWRELPTDDAEYVLDQLDLLAAGPVARSRPSKLPAYRFQLFRFSGPRLGPYAVFEVRFQYSQDEQTLHVYDIMWTYVRD